MLMALATMSFKKVSNYLVVSKRISHSFVIGFDKNAL